MHLSELKITGYKVFNEEFTVKFNPGLTVLVGENSSGKTAIIDSIRLLLNEDEFGKLGISDSHFHRPFSKTNSESSAEGIQINGVFSKLEPEQQVAYLPWLNANDNTIASLNIKIDNKQNGRGRYDRIAWGGESVSGIFEWELLNSIACIYLPPLRDAESKLEAFRGSRLSRLFKKDKPASGEKHDLEKKFEKFNTELLETSDTIKNANNAIRKYLKDSLGHVLGQDAVIQFSETKFDRIVERLRLLFYPKIIAGTSSELFREISENSLGYNNILYVATVLAELEGLDHAKTQHKILLIEEPEAHLHPQLQIRLLQYLKKEAAKGNIQIIVTTHSSTITASCGLMSLNVLTLQPEKNPKATLLSDCGLSKESEFFLERWLDITKSLLFFAKGILFVEGIAEALVVKELAKTVIKKYAGTEDHAPVCLEDYGISIINLNGIYFRHFMQLFQGYKLDKAGNTIAGIDCIPIKCAAITDCDPLPVLTTKPTKQTPCECGNTQSKGFADELIKFSSSNCRVFYNLKTFEYDLAMEGNNLQTLHLINYESYERQVAGAVEAKQKSEKDWSVIEDTEKAEECMNLLTIAKEDEGKGIFAQKLALKLYENNHFVVPLYIESAILWVTGLKKPDVSSN